MKKTTRMTLILSFVAACLMALSSCLLVPTGPAAEPDNLIYNDKSELFVVVADAAFPSLSVDSIYNRIALHTDDAPKITNVYQEGKHNVVIGQCSAPVSVEAYKKLAALDPGEDDAAFVVYSDGASVAIAYKFDAYDYAHTELMYYLINELICPELILPAGVVKSVCFDAVERVADKDEQLIAKAWQEFEKATSPALAEAMQELYGIYSNEVVVWFAELYDPGEGGFYFSNSGRDTYSFLPDLESTAQALGFLNGSGMFDRNGGNWATNLPEEMRKALGDFAYRLQDPDGYFYHPQWGKDIINSRRSRDLSHGVSILKSLGISPKYKTITNVGGDLDPASFLTEGLGSGSAVSAVSKVVAVEGGLIPDHLSTPAKFEAYVNELFDKNSSYVAGHNLSSQSTEIRARGQEYVDITLKVLNERQCDNGIWQEEINYLGVNGLMKISGVYNGMKAAIPNAEAAASAALFAITTEEATNSIVEIWNAWAAADRITKNIANYGDPAVADSIRQRLIDDAPTYLEATRDKVLAFRRDDYSFSYNVSGKTSGKSQSASVSVAGTVEGDVNATVIAITNMLSSIHGVMGLDSVMVPLLTEIDRIKFIRTVEELTPIVKEAPTLVEPDPTDFDDLTPGSLADEAIGVRTNMNLGSATITEDPREGASGNVIMISKPSVPDSSGGDSIYIDNMATGVTASCNVFEMEMCFDTIDRDKASLIELRTQGSASSKVGYSLYFSTEGGKVFIKERGVSDGTMDRDITDALRIGEWFKFRIEYYVGDHDTVRIKLFINDEPIAVSDNYYDTNGTKATGTPGKPESAFASVRIFFNKPPKATYYIDNVRTYQINAPYTVQQTVDPFGYNVDMAPVSNSLYDFESEELPEELAVNGAAVEQGELYMPAGSSVVAPASVASAGYNCVSVSMDLTLPSSAAGDILTLVAQDRNLKPNDLFRYKLRTTGDGLVLVPVISGGEGSAISLPGVSLGDQISLAVDYYPESNTALIYVDGDIVAASTAVATSAATRYFSSATISSSSEVIVDNLFVAKTERDFAAATDPAGSQKKESFESGKGGVSTDGSIVDRDGGKALLLGSGDEMQIDVNERAVAKNVTSFQFSLDLSECDSGDGVVAYILTEDGTPGFALRFTVKNGSILVSEICEEDEISAVVYTIQNKTAADIAMKYYAAEGALVLLVDGEAVIESGIVYSDATAGLFGAACAIISDGTAYVDDVIAENMMELRIESEVGAAPEEDGVIGFETATNSTLPGKLTTTLSSAGAKVGVLAMMKRGELTKALYASSKNGAIDRLQFATTSYESGSAYVLECDVMIPTEASGSQWQFKLMSDSRIAYMLFVGTKSGKIYMSESSYENATDGDGNARRLIEHAGVASVGEWFRLRIEYIPDGDRATVNLYVDDELIVEDSDCVYGSQKPSYTAPQRIDAAMFQSFKTINTDIYIDDLSLGKFEP